MAVYSCVTIFLCVKLCANFLFSKPCGCFHVVVFCGTLGVWGELASHKRLFNPPPQFSRLGIQVSLRPNIFHLVSYLYVNMYMYMYAFVCLGWDDHLGWDQLFSYSFS